MKEESLIFLISQPRSGSTLTQRILDAHSKIYTRSEPWIMLHSAYSIKQTGFEINYNRKNWVKSFNDFIENLPEKAKMSYIEELRKFHLNLYNRYLLDNNKKYFLDKTPRYYHILDELFEVFPNAKYILLVRNPLAVLNSILKTWVKDYYRKLYLFKEDLIDAIDNISFYIQKENLFNIYIMKYEDLVENMEHEIEKICTYLGIEFEDSFKTYFEVSTSKWLYGDSVNAFEKKGIDKASRDNWIAGLQDKQVWRLMYDYINLIGKEKYKILGYDFNKSIKILEENMPEKCLKTILENTISLKKLIVSKENINKKKSRLNTFYGFCEELKDIDQTYIIYGYGQIGRMIGELLNERIVGYVDKLSNLIKINNVYPVEDLKCLGYDKIIISVLGQETSILNHLINKLNIDKNKIITLDI